MIPFKTSSIDLKMPSHQFSQWNKYIINIQWSWFFVSWWFCSDNDVMKFYQDYSTTTASHHLVFFITMTGPIMKLIIFSMSLLGNDVLDTFICLSSTFLQGRLREIFEALFQSSHNILYMQKISSCHITYIIFNRKMNFICIHQQCKCQIPSCKGIGS